MSISDLFKPPLLLCGVLVAQAVWAVAASAQESQATTAGLAIETLAERRVEAENEGAQVGYVAADQLHIGDEIFYTVRVRNTINTALDEVVVIKAVPRNTQYVADSAVGPGADIDFSIDGGATFAVPGALELTMQPGVTRRASANDYTHIRWRLRHPLAAGATALLRFRGVFK